MSRGILTGKDRVEGHAGIFCMCILEPGVGRIPGVVSPMNHLFTQPYKEFLHPLPVEVVVTPERLPDQAFPGLRVSRDNPGLTETKLFDKVAKVVAITPGRHELWLESILVNHPSEKLPGPLGKEAFWPGSLEFPFLSDRNVQHLRALAAGLDIEDRKVFWVHARKAARKLAIRGFPDTPQHAKDQVFAVRLDQKGVAPLA
jgi:hypothetical protein